MFHGGLDRQTWDRCRSSSGISPSCPSLTCSTRCTTSPASLSRASAASPSVGGLLPELIEPGVTSFIVHKLEEAVRAVAHSHTSSGRRCWQVFDTRLWPGPGAP
jgi:hypothetical protein